MPVIENKKIILLLGCLTLFFPGSFVFGYPGVMAGYWQTEFSVNKAQIGRLMFFILAGTGFSMYLAGKLQEKVAFHRLIFTGSVICGAAMLFAGRAQSMVHIYAWGFVEGFFCGFVYIPCLTFFQKLFPLRKGLVAGIMNLTFGGAAAVMSPFFSWLLITRGYTAASDTAAVLCMVIAGSAALFVRNPDETGDTLKKPVVPTLTVRQVLGMKPFWFLWLVWALSGAAGVSLIVLSAVYGRHLGYDVSEYVIILTCFNVLNGVGRLVCGRLSDLISKQKILMTIYLLAAAAYVGMALTTSLFWISFFACFVGLAFGGLFTVSAPLVTEVFGIENFGKIFGLVFTAYGFFAGALGPWLSGVILDVTGTGFGQVFCLFAAFYIIAAILILQVKPLPEHQAAGGSTGGQARDTIR